MKALAAAIVAIGLGTSAMAQDIAPAMDLPTMAQGQVISSTAKAQARRSGRNANGLSPQAAATCANKASARARFGANDRRVARLYDLCAKAGM